MKYKRLQVFMAMVLIAAMGLLFGAGCKPAECRQMMKCCEEIKDVEGVGAACGPIASQTKEAATCSSVLQTVGYMLEDKQLPIPDACR